MPHTTEADAKTKPCPIARVQGDADADGNVISTCRGSECLFWRWRNDIHDPFWQSAVKREQLDLKTNNPDWHAKKVHDQAVANVNANPAGYIGDPDFPQRSGYCGLGGKP